MRIGFRVLLDSRSDAAVRITLAQDRVDGAAENPGIAVTRFALRIVCGFFRVIGNIEALGLQFADCRGQLRYRRTDVRQLDDVRVGRLGKRAELGERVADALLVGQALREVGQDAPGQRDVARLDVDARGIGKGFDDRQ